MFLCVSRVCARCQALEHHCRVCSQTEHSDFANRLITRAEKWQGQLAYARDREADHLRRVQALEACTDVVEAPNASLLLRQPL
jgi:hypothetical protein